MNVFTLIVKILLLEHLSCLMDATLGKTALWSVLAIEMLWCSVLQVYLSQDRLSH